MSIPGPEWERRISQLWSEVDRYREEQFLASIDALVEELGPGSAIGLFERGAAFDSTGHADRALPLYEAALSQGLVGERRRRAVIQMASTLRNLGKPREALSLLTAESGASSDQLDGAVASFLALTLTDLGREREAAQVALVALAKYLPRYNRSVTRYAQELAEKGH